MEDGTFTPNSIPSDTTTTTTIIDFNLMNELLYDGFWLEASDGSNFWQHAPTTLSNLNSTSSILPTSDTHLNTNPHQDSFLKVTTKSSFFSSNPPLSYLEEMSGSQPQNHEADDDPSVSLNQSANEQTQVNTRRLWVGANRNPIGTISVKKRLVQAIKCLSESIGDTDVLIQIWIPVKRGGRQVLTTTNQPFSLNPNYKNLAHYRDVSQNYLFAADEDSKEFIGLPGRVFLNKLPEWTPDVRFFKREEYPRVNHAQHHDVRGSLALPVFEQGSGICLGVVEIVTATQKVNYRPELENICKALEAVNLKSSNILSPSNIEDSDEVYQGIMREIRNTLKFICETHKLPLAQTWASCVEQCKGGCRHSDENYARCVSTIEAGCYVGDPLVSGFHEACSEHHLLKGEGVAGKAFLTNQPCFAQDITAFSKTEYPLAHHARMFNLCASAAVRLRSTYNGTADFVLEFFFPSNCKDAEHQMQMLMLHLLSSLIQQTCQCLRVITDDEVLAQETSGREEDASSWLMRMRDPQDKKGKGISVPLDNHKEEFKVTTPQWDKSVLDSHYVPSFLDHHQLQQDFGPPKTSSQSCGNFSLTMRHPSSGSKTSRRTKTEKNISLQVLRQYFAGSLKEAAKSIGVCPTTLKRICRQHGISRWPSRKIKKVGHSLKKLQLVIDSVQGAEGSIQLTSFYNNFPELVSPNIPGSTHFSTSQLSGHLQQQVHNYNNQPEANFSPPSSSGSHSSSSSYCCSTGVKQSSFPGDALLAKQVGGMLKRARSDAELHDHEKDQDGTKLMMIRSYSHKILSDQTPKNSSSSQAAEADHLGTFRVKACFGEEKIRFSLPPQWGFKDLQQEVWRRFNIDNNGSSFNLKYLDDDAEWVLMTCDADLEECIDIHRSSKSHAIKLSVNQPYHPSLGSSFGSNGPY